MNRTLALLLLPLCAASLRAATDHEEPRPPVSRPAATPAPALEDYYFTCVRAVEGGEVDSLLGIDFARLRWSYFEATKGGHLPATDPDAERKLGAAFAASEWDEVVKQADAILRSNLTRIRAHALKAYALKELGRDPLFHVTAMRRLLESILATGDGRSEETAYHVLFVPEERDVLMSRQLRPGGQELVESKGRYFDVLTARDAEGKEVRVWFDITEHFQRLTELFR